MIRSRVSTSTSQPTITRRPFGLTISIRLPPDPQPFSGCSGTIIAGTNPRGRAKPLRAIGPAPRKQKLIGNPVPTPRRRGQPRTRQTLLDDANLCLIRPSTAPTRVNILKTTDIAGVSIPTVSYIPANSARRPTPGGYPESDIAELPRKRFIATIRPVLCGGVQFRMATFGAPRQERGRHRPKVDDRWPG